MRKYVCWFSFITALLFASSGLMTCSVTKFNLKSYCRLYKSNDISTNALIQLGIITLKLNDLENKKHMFNEFMLVAFKEIQLNVKL